MQEAFGTGVGQILDDFGGGGAKGVETILDGAIADGHGEMSFAAAGLAVEDQRAALGDEDCRRVDCKVKSNSPSLHKLIELLPLQQFIEPLIGRMSWRRGQLHMSDPNVFLLFPLLARSHCHTRILRILPVDTSHFSLRIRTYSPGC